MFLWTAVHMVLGIAQPTDANDLFNCWSNGGGTNHNLNLLTSTVILCWSYQEMKLFLINIDLNLFCRCYSEGRTVSDNGPCYNILKTVSNS